MHIVRFAVAESPEARIGVQLDDSITELGDVGGMAELLRLPVERLRERLTGATGVTRRAAEVTLLPPVDGLTEVWACGVTYKISQDARMEESERAASVYERVYDAARPELFFKSVAWRVVGHDEPIAIREDSLVDVPEPEVALVVNALGEIAGYAVCNDVSSRTIEGENPLYLPQAKMYLGACSVGPAIRPAWEVNDPYGLSVRMTIRRAGEQVWEGAASTSQLYRRFDELVGYLRRADIFPDGAVLSTGTCLVPASPFTLQPGDVVAIEVDEIGRLVNRVVRGGAQMAWLCDSIGDVGRRA